MYWLLTPFVTFYTAINHIASVGRQPPRAIRSIYSAETNYVPTFGNSFYKNDSSGPLLEEEWQDDSNIISVDAYREPCSTPILQRMGYFHLYLIAKTQNRRNYKLHRQYKFIVEDPKYNTKLGEFITHCRPSSNVTMKQLRRQMKKISRMYNLIDNNCYHFGAWVMRTLGCIKKATILQSIRYDRKRNRK